MASAAAGVPAIWAPVASAANSREREIADLDEKSGNRRQDQRREQDDRIRPAIAVVAAAAEKHRRSGDHHDRRGNGCGDAAGENVTILDVRQFVRDHTFELTFAEHLHDPLGRRDSRMRGIAPRGKRVRRRVRNDVDLGHRQIRALGQPCGHLIQPVLGTDDLRALGANAYARHTGGAITTDPTPGPLVERPLFVGATESAHGVELSVRKLTGRATGQLAYSYGHATMDARGFSFPAPASRTHALDAAMTIRFGGFDIGGGYALTSGAPFTRTVFRSASGDPGTPGASPVAERETPNAQRLPSYAGLDLSLDYARRFHAASLIRFAGIQNVLGRKNSTWYEFSGPCGGDQPQAATAPECRDRDVLEAPVAFAPRFGVRVVFE